jgi:hypothetical protein
MIGIARLPAQKAERLRHRHRFQLAGGLAELDQRVHHAQVARHVGAQELEGYRSPQSASAMTRARIGRLARRNRPRKRNAARRFSVGRVPRSAGR